MTAETVTASEDIRSQESARQSELFTKMLRGDDRAFEVLFAAFDGRLRRYVARQLSAQAEGPIVQDMLQEVWIRFINLRQQPPRRVDGPFHVQAFLFRIAHNLVIDRRRTLKQHTSIDTLDECHHPTTRHPAKLDVEEVVERAFALLPEDFREVLELNIHLGYRLDEIAEMLEKSPEAIWQRASRARAKLRTLVVELARKEGVSLREFISPRA